MERESQPQKDTVDSTYNEPMHQSNPQNSAKPSTESVNGKSLPENDAEGSDTETDESFHDAASEEAEKSGNSTSKAQPLTISVDDDNVEERTPDSTIPFTRRQQRLSVKYIHKEFQSRPSSASKDSGKKSISPLGEKRSSPEQESPNLQQPDLNSMLLPEGQGKSRKHHRILGEESEADTPVPRRLALRKAAMATAASNQSQQLEQISALVQTTESARSERKETSPPFTTYIGQGPPTAYTLFIQHNLEKRKTTDVTTLAQEWARTSPRHRKVWHEKATKLISQGGDSSTAAVEEKGKRKQSPKNQSANSFMGPPPKRPKNAFVLFLHSNLASCKENYPDLSHQEVVAFLGNQWKNGMSQEAKQKYLDDADERRKEYERQVRLYAQSTSTTQPSAAAPNSRRPPGRPPKGKVWDIVRGCWVNANDTPVNNTSKTEDSSPSRQSQTKKRKSSQKAVTSSRPRGRAPKGLVWDESVKSWVENMKTLPQTKTSAQENSVSDDAMPSHMSTAANLENGAVKKKPRGRVPHGKTWDENLGQWVVQQEKERSPGVTVGESTQPKEAQDTNTESTEHRNEDVEGETAMITKEATESTTKGSIKRPRGRAPQGKEWDDSSGSWVVLGTRNPVKLSAKKRPRGRGPLGKVWSESQGCWVPESISIEPSNHRSTSLTRSQSESIDVSEAFSGTEAHFYRPGNGNAPPASSAHKQVLPTSSRRRPQRRREDKKGKQGKKAPSPNITTAESSAAPINSKPSLNRTELAAASDPSEVVAKSSRPKKSAAKAPPRTPAGMQWDAARGVWKPRMSESSTNSIPGKGWAQLVKENQNTWGGDSPSRKYSFPNRPTPTHPTPQNDSPNPADVQDPPSKSPPKSNFEKLALKTGRLGEDGSIYPQLNKPLIRLPDWTFQRPIGKSPTGYKWDGVRAVWKPDTFEEFVACGTCPNCMLTSNCDKCLSCRNRSGTCCLRVCITPIVQDNQEDSLSYVDVGNL